ncbi:DUF485 domain-containing protein [Allosalinactinospora lopnorensis]|uniref:DUF485 domain-containing protein n=1 Tax=Allosalinactinospora lopnorensis TaxID=1352348 RepID=UPI000623BDFE|nr:DUF485 domain-containing protein [Allosalinactinospora lopnorensis]
MVSTSRGSPEQGATEDGLSARSIAMHSDPRFNELKRRLRVFVFPMSAAFMAWYLLYVVMSAYARDAMATVLFGPVNVALVFGVLQFLSTFGIAILYSRYADRRLDPLANELLAELSGPGAASHGRKPAASGGTAGKKGGQS